MLKSYPVRIQMERMLCGVGTINLSQDEIRSLLEIWLLSPASQAEIRGQMEASARLHEDAMAMMPAKGIAGMWVVQS